MITNTDTLQMFTKIYNKMTADEQQEADKVISGEWYKAEPYKAMEAKYQDLGFMDFRIPLLIGEAIRAIKQDIKQTENGKKKTSSKRSIVNKMLKKNVKNRVKEAMTFTFVKDDRQYVSDGISLYSFAEVDDQFPICPDNLKDSYLKVDPIFNNARDNCNQELELPSTKLLEAYIKNGKKKLDYCFGIDLPTLVADNLLNALKAVPTMKLYWDGKITTSAKDNTKGALSPLYGIDENGNEVILLPVKDGTEEHAGQEKTRL